MVIIPEHLCDTIIAFVEERHLTFLTPSESVSCINIAPCFKRLTWTAMDSDLRAAICHAIDIAPTHKAVGTIEIARFLTGDFLPPIRCGRNITDATFQQPQRVLLWCLTDSDCDGITFIQGSKVIKQLDKKGDCFFLEDFDWLWVSPVLGLSRYTLSISY